MIPRRPIPKAPGGPPLSDKRDLYIQLMAKGMSNSAACKMIGINRRTGTRWRRGRTILNRAGQARIYAPIVRSRPADSGRQLSEAERVLIADGLLAGRSLRAIAAELGRSPSTVSREVARNRDHSGRYHPFRAHAQAASRRARPKPAKLAQSSELRAFVEDRLRRRWSPEQSSSALVVEFPDREDMRVACETIYQAIYVPARGNLTRELARNLRTGRLRRRPQRRADRRTRRFVEPMRLICDRPAEVATRSVVGHWEGDLLMGTRNRSAIGTLVERATGYVALVHLPNGHTAEEVSSAVMEVMVTLPGQLWRSITWDQGSEMACHGELTAATGIPVYFCDPASPWQRGTNENTNGLLRQYFPKGQDLRRHDGDHLTAVAAELNERPRRRLGWTSPAALIGSLLGRDP